MKKLFLLILLLLIILFILVIIPKDPGPVVDIIDLTQVLPINVASANEAFFLEDGIVYYFGTCKSGEIIIRYADGSKEQLKSALRKGRATISDLDKFGIDYSTRSAWESDYIWWQEENERN